jgi:hypothetical protein
LLLSSTKVETILEWDKVGVLSTAIINMNIIYYLITLFFVGINVPAQTSRSPVLKKGQPSVFISQVSSTTPDPDYVILKLTNNLRFKLGIVICSGPADVDIIDHRFEDENHAVRRYGGCHVGTMIRLRPGRSIRFAVDREDLKNSFQLAVPFIYDWESWGELNEPEHFVYISSESVFESVKNKK